MIPVTTLDDGHGYRRHLHQFSAKVLAFGATEAPVKGCLCVFANLLCKDGYPGVRGMILLAPFGVLGLAFGRHLHQYLSQVHHGTSLHAHSASGISPCSTRAISPPLQRGHRLPLGRLEDGL
jgi:hypothetical protein